MQNFKAFGFVFVLVKANMLRCFFFFLLWKIVYTMMFLNYLFASRTMTSIFKQALRLNQSTFSLSALNEYDTLSQKRKRILPLFQTLSLWFFVNSRSRHNINRFYLHKWFFFFFLPITSIKPPGDEKQYRKLL